MRVHIGPWPVAMAESHALLVLVLLPLLLVLLAAVLAPLTRHRHGQRGTSSSSRSSRNEDTGLRGNEPLQAAPSTDFGLDSLSMEPKNRNEMAHTSFFFSFATMPADLPFSFTKAAGARSIIAVPAFHFSLVLLALVSALISASDAVSSKAASSFLIRLGWFCNPQWLVMSGPHGRPVATRVFQDLADHEVRHRRCDDHFLLCRHRHAQKFRGLVLGRVEPPELAHVLKQGHPA